MLVSDLVNVRYLSGFAGSNAALLVFADDTPPVLATDARYRTQAARQAPDLRTVIERACGRHLVQLALVGGARRIGFESHIVTVDGLDSLACALTDYPPRIWFGPPAPWRRCARSRTPARWRCSGWPARPPTPRWPHWCSAVDWARPHRARRGP